MSADRIYYLLDRLFQQRCTPEEKEELVLWIETVQNEEEWISRLMKIWESYEPKEKMNVANAEIILKSVFKKNQELQSEQNLRLHHPNLSSSIMRWAVAAAAVIGILIILSVAFLIKKPVGTESETIADNATSQRNTAIMPGSNKATLTLANGEKIILDSVQKGHLAVSQNTDAVKVNNGLLSYNGRSPLIDNRHQIQYNTISTPIGGQYQIILADGSKIWLNAASSLKFPTRFAGEIREVFAKGEIYAEIAKNENKPFVVHVLSPSGEDKGTVKVLGTSFNINAYEDNTAVKTTLLHGSVKVEYGNNEKILNPGEQALSDNEGIRVKNDVYINEIIAWKNGLFDFRGNNIQEVMQRISRWYNVKVKYKNNPSAHFMGTISRNSDISEVLTMLEMTGAVHFKVEGNTITVME